MNCVIVLSICIVWWLFAHQANAPTEVPEVDPYAEAREVLAKKDDVIRITNLVPGGTISSPFILEGEARGTWFFEASFPIEIQTESGTLIGTVIATAEEEWMTADFVAFSASIVVPFHAQVAGPLNLVLRKDNPSGLPENDDSIVIPVILQ